MSRSDFLPVAIDAARDAGATLMSFLERGVTPEYKGKAAILDVPAIGIMDAALCFESAGEIKYGNKGNMTKSEIDFTITVTNIAPQTANNVVVVDSLPAEGSFISSNPV